MSVEHDEGADVSGAQAPPRSRLRRTTLLASAAVIAGAAVLAAYWTLRHGDVAPSSLAPTTSQAPVAAVPRELTSEAATQLLATALSRRPLVARVALGDVVTIDKNGQALPLYPQLAQAQIVRLRFCHFPGADAPANQICLADLADNAKQYVYAGENPFKAMPVGADGLQAKNRSFAQLILAVPRVKQVSGVADRRRGEKQIAYTAAFELTPLAGVFGVTAESMPSSIAGTADARAGAAGWSIENDGLQETEAKAN
jgi:hypothetical protein